MIIVFLYVKNKLEKGRCSAKAPFNGVIHLAMETFFFILVNREEEQRKITLFIKAPELIPDGHGLVDEEEVYRMFGGCLPVARTTATSFLNHQGNLVDKGRKLRIF